MKRYLVIEDRYYHSNVTGLPDTRIDGKYDTEDEAREHIAKRIDGKGYRQTERGDVFHCSEKYDSGFYIHEFDLLKRLGR